MAIFDVAGQALPALLREIGKLDSHARICRARIDASHASGDGNGAKAGHKGQRDSHQSSRIVQEIRLHKEPRVAQIGHTAVHDYGYRIVLGIQGDRLAAPAASIVGWDIHSDAARLN